MSATPFTTTAATALFAVLMMAAAPSDARSRGGVRGHHGHHGLHHLHGHFRSFASFRFRSGGVFYSTSAVAVRLPMEDTTVMYIEQGAQSPSAAPAWYFCEDSWQYYPQVQSCDGPWLPVAPRLPEAG